MPARDPELEQQVLDWIAALTGEVKPEKEKYEDFLRDGLVLCKLINKLAPGSVKRTAKKGSGNFALMENVSAFQKGVRKYGVPDEEIFQTCDLFEFRNVPQVTMSLLALARQTQNHPEYDGPQIGPKIAEENKREFTQEQLDEGKHCVNAIQMGYTGGANQSGTNMGNTRHM